MAKVIIEFTKEDLTTMVEEIKGWTGIIIPKKELRKLLNKADIETKVQIAEGCSSTYGLDTGARELLMDELAFELVGKSWPLYADGERSGKNFMNDLEQECEKRGWKIETE